jgi:hypothetical protein
VATIGIEITKFFEKKSVSKLYINDEMGVI